MLSVNEVLDKSEKSELAKRFNVKINESDRCFLEKDDDKETGLFCAENIPSEVHDDNDVKIKHIVMNGDYDFSFFDMLVRASLNVIRNVKNIRVYIETEDDYFTTLGFKKNGTFYEINTNDLIFGCCKNQKKN